MASTHDVCIVGAGIAGSSLAYELAPEFKVCVVEEKGLDEVGKKPCPGAVQKSWFRGFSPEDFGAVGRRVRRMRLSVGGRSLRVKFDGYVINRHRLCRGLLEAAFAEGCDWVRGKAEPSFVNGVEHVRADGKRIEAEVYVDASGTSAVLRRHYLPNRREMFVSGCMETVDVEQGDDELGICLINHRETGWIFPAEHSTNIGYVAAGGGGQDILERLAHFKEGMGLGRVKTLDRGYGLIPSHRPIRLVYGNVVAIGDAGFTVNPITCGGIGPSVLVSNMLAESLERGEDLGVFEAEYRKSLGNKFEKFYRINHLLRKSWLPLWWATKAYYGDSPLGKLVKQLTRL
jgi:flavin-dependent dehydrogenase